MNKITHSPKLLKTLLITGWILFAIGIISEVFFPLPEALQEWNESQMSSAFAGFIAVLALIGWLVGSIGLFRLKRWGIAVYLASTAAGLVSSLLTGLLMSSAFSGSIEYLLSLNEGFIIALLFLKSPIK